MFFSLGFVFCAVAVARATAATGCYTGFVMDKFCINRGTLLDNPSVVSLEGPEKHSVHCLVDVPQCHKSGYEMLAPPLNGGATYRRAFELDALGNEKVIRHARATGDKAQGCTTCTGDGSLKMGYRATIVGT